MPIVVCAVCLAQKASGHATPPITTGFYTIVNGTAFCEEHIPSDLKRHAETCSIRSVPEGVEPKKKRGRPPANKENNTEKQLTIVTDGRDGDG